MLRIGLRRHLVFVQIGKWAKSTRAGVVVKMPHFARSNCRHGCQRRRQFKTHSRMAMFELKRPTEQRRLSLSMPEKVRKVCLYKELS
jgi:hypothetical protein